MRPQAERNVKSRIALNAIAKAEKIEVSQEDIDKEIEFLAMQYQMEPAKVKEILGPDNMASIEKDVRMRNAMDVIFKNVKFKAGSAKKETAKKETAEKKPAAKKAPAKKTTKKADK